VCFRVLCVRKHVLKWHFSYRPQLVTVYIENISLQHSDRLANSR